MNSPDFPMMRRAMIDSQLRTSGVTSPWIIAAMGKLPRETFVPADFMATAYMDRAIPLGGGHMLNPPLATGLMLDAAALQAGDRVLLIGAATGYLAALIAGRVAHVSAVETSHALLTLAKTNVAQIANLSLIERPLVAGAPENGPFDVIIIDGAIAALPDALVDQVVEGGRVVAGVFDGPVTRVALGHKHNGVVVLRPTHDCEIAVIPEFQQTQEFVF